MIEKKVSALTSSLSFRLCCFRLCRNDDVFLLLWCDGRARIRLRSLLPEEERSWHQQLIKYSSERKHENLSRSNVHARLIFYERGNKAFKASNNQRIYVITKTQLRKMEIVPAHWNRVDGSKSSTHSRTYACCGVPTCSTTSE